MPFLQKIGLSALPLGIVSLFVFPWAITLILMAVAAFAFPPSALFLGVLADILYYPGTSLGFALPVGTLWGAGLLLLGWGVRHVLKTRILR